MRLPARNEWVRGVCGKPQVKCGECPNQAFIALSDNVFASHLRGADPSRSSSADYVGGLYPVRVDETCCFLAVDFDGDNWSIERLWQDRGRSGTHCPPTNQYSGAVVELALYPLRVRKTSG